MVWTLEDGSEATTPAKNTAHDPPAGAFFKHSQQAKDGG